MIPPLPTLKHLSLAFVYDESVDLGTSEIEDMVHELDDRLSFLGNVSATFHRVKLRDALSYPDTLVGKRIGMRSPFLYCVVLLMVHIQSWFCMGKFRDGSSTTLLE